MKLYRVHLREDGEGSHGYVYTATEREARREAAKFKQSLKGVETCGAARCTIDVIDVEPNKAGILAALNKYAGHPATGKPLLVVDNRN